MEDDSGIKLKSLNVDGGASRNNFLMQFQSDLIQTQVQRPATVETTALGAAKLSGIAVDFWDNSEKIKKSIKIEKVFKPEINKDEVKKKIKRWHKAVKKSKKWAK